VLVNPSDLLYRLGTKRDADKLGGPVRFASLPA
jgi:hypothetical protein